MKPLPRAGGRCQYCGTRIKSDAKTCGDCRKLADAEKRMRGDR